jgi:hypothetical protein
MNSDISPIPPGPDTHLIPVSMDKQENNTPVLSAQAAEILGLNPARSAALSALFKDHKVNRETLENFLKKPQNGGWNVMAVDSLFISQTKTDFITFEQFQGFVLNHIKRSEKTQLQWYQGERFDTLPALSEQQVTLLQQALYAQTELPNGLGKECLDEQRNIQNRYHIIYLIKDLITVQDRENGITAGLDKYFIKQPDGCSVFDLDKWEEFLTEFLPQRETAVFHPPIEQIEPVEDEYDEYIEIPQDAPGITVYGEREEFPPNSPDAAVLQQLNDSSRARKEFIEEDFLKTAGFRRTANVKFRKTTGKEKAMATLHGVFHAFSGGIVPLKPFVEVDYDRLDKGMFYDFSSVLANSPLKEQLTPEVRTALELEYMLQVQFSDGILIRIWNLNYYTEENIAKFEQLARSLPDSPASIGQLKKRYLEEALPRIKLSWEHYTNPTEEDKQIERLNKELWNMRIETL